MIDLRIYTGDIDIRTPEIVEFILKQLTSCEDIVFEDVEKWAEGQLVVMSPWDRVKVQREIYSERLRRKFV